MEVGLKLDILENKISATVSYFDIKVINQVHTDLERDPVNGNRFQSQDGNQTSKGLDFELFMNPVNGFNVVAGYAYNSSKLVKANENVNGRRPTNSGAKNTANLWASYRITNGRAKGLGIGGGAITAGTICDQQHDKRIHNSCVHSAGRYCILRPAIVSYRA